MIVLPALPAELTIHVASELRASWLAALEAAAPEGDCLADASGVVETDAAGLQLLVALSRQLAAGGRALRLRHPSEPLLDACAALGLESLASRDHATVPGAA